MNSERFNDGAQRAFATARRIRESYRHREVDIEHLLFAMLEQPNSLAAQHLQKAGSNPGYVRTQLEGELQRWPAAAPGGEAPAAAPAFSSIQPYVSARLRDLFERARAEADKMGDALGGVDHLLICMIEETDRGASARI